MKPNQSQTLILISIPLVFELNIDLDVLLKVNPNFELDSELKF